MESSHKLTASTDRGAPSVRAGDNRTSSFDVIRYQTISKFSIESGYTEWAIRGKIRDGVWLEGRVWVKAPDGRILISIEGYNLWAEAGLACAPSVEARSKSPLPIAGFDVVRGSGSSPPPLT